MEQQLRHYERLSPQLAVLVETPNINYPSTLMTDYLVTGARGWDWLCQLHPNATIINLEDPSLNKAAADELVEFPSLVRAYDDGVGFCFVITPLGAESKAYVEAIEVKLKNAPARGLTKDMVIVDDAPYTNEGKENVTDLNEAPKADINTAMACPKVNAIAIVDRDVVTYDGVVEYTPLIRKWAEDRNIIGGGSSTLDQFLKGLTEAGELWGHVGKGQHDLMKDDIGDVYVCLVNAAGNLNINLEEHVRPLEALPHHSGRAMYQRRGLKRYSLQVLYTLAAVSQSIENILDCDDERDIEFYKTDFSDACADVVYVLETIALEQDWSLTECIIAAYEDIKDRKGLMVNGSFVKEKDFTEEMVSAALDDDRVKPETKAYLREWCMQQLSDQSQEMEACDRRSESINAVNGSESVTGIASASAPAPVTAELKKPFWRVWKEAEGELQNVPAFALSIEVLQLLNDQKDDQIAVTLGVFGQVNHNNEVYLMDAGSLKTAMDRLVGKVVGEINNPVREAGQDVTAWLKRVATADLHNSAGILVDYAINQLGKSDHGPVIEVIGLVAPSDFTKDRIATTGNAHFGIRAIVVTNGQPSPVINHVKNLVCFDLSIENPRELKM